MFPILNGLDDIREPSPHGHSTSIVAVYIFNHIDVDFRASQKHLDGFEFSPTGSSYQGSVARPVLLKIRQRYWEYIHS